MLIKVWVVCLAFGWLAALFTPPCVMRHSNATSQIFAAALGRDAAPAWLFFVADLPGALLACVVLEMLSSSSAFRWLRSLRLHSRALRCVALRCAALRCVALRYVTLR